MKRVLVSAAVALSSLACASTAKIDMKEPRRVVGTENSVRVDAEILGEEVSIGARVPITCVITNQRSTAIAIADLIPDTVYDAESRTITVGMGSEVPGATLLPRLIEIPPGGHWTLQTTARVGFVLPRNENGNPGQVMTGLRLKVNFLGDTSGGFQALIGIAEKGIADPKLADELFPLWLERNEVVYTNSVPMHWVAKPEAAD